MTSAADTNSIITRPIHLYWTYSALDNQTEDKRAGSRTRTYSDQELSDVVEAALRTEDLNSDGYIEYWEFMATQAKRREVKPPGFDGQ
ncbi:hypothetical protein ElyMa_003355500 [Elysia marginata]|uniref:EF-hand domain-containing protein n=1 Tax=Elysia marginata TaxID=1093978 RepID=A0AAV4JJS7_9GAST|nr:hypothetical protein ElyMa_003355500 [Elysia marginata]